MTEKSHPHLIKEAKMTWAFRILLAGGPAVLLWARGSALAVVAQKPTSWLLKAAWIPAVLGIFGIAWVLGNKELYPAGNPMSYWYDYVGVLGGVFALVFNWFFALFITTQNPEIYGRRVLHIFKMIGKMFGPIE